MHPTMISALANQMTRERTRESQQISLRWLALRERGTRATNSPFRIAAGESVRHLLVVPRLLARHRAARFDTIEPRPVVEE